MEENNEELMDIFAGLAMQAIIQSEHHMAGAELLYSDGKNIEIQDAIAMLAYTQANAMLKIKSKLKNENRNNKNKSMEI